MYVHAGGRAAVWEGRAISFFPGALSVLLHLRPRELRLFYWLHSLPLLARGADICVYARECARVLGGRSGAGLFSCSPGALSLSSYHACVLCPSFCRAMLRSPLADGWAIQAERAGRRQEVLRFEANWSQLQALRDLVNEDMSSSSAHKSSSFAEGGSIFADTARGVAVGVAARCACNTASEPSGYTGERGVTGGSGGGGQLSTGNVRVEQQPRMLKQQQQHHMDYLNNLEVDEDDAVWGGRGLDAGAHWELATSTQEGGGTRHTHVESRSGLQDSRRANPQIVDWLVREEGEGVVVAGGAGEYTLAGEGRGGYGLGAGGAGGGSQTLGSILGGRGYTIGGGLPTELQQQQHMAYMRSLEQDEDDAL